MGIKRTLAELVLAAAAVLLPSCDTKVEKETVYVDQFQNPIMNFRTMSSDSHFVGLSFNQGTDVEACVFDTATETMSNVSNDPVRSDFPLGFVGGHLVTRCKTSDDVEQLKVYDSAGVLRFESEAFEDFFNYMPHTDSKFLIETEKDDENTYVFDVNAMSLEKLVSSAEWSNICNYSQDCSVIFVRADDGTSRSLHMTKSGVLSQVLTGSHYVECVSDNNKKAVLYDFGSEDMKILDIDTNTLQNVVMPFGSSLCQVHLMSQNGLAAVMRLHESSGDNFYHLDIPSGTWKLINPTAMDMNPDYMSADGSLIQFHDFSKYGDCLLYNASTQELYSPITDFEDEEFVGFTFDNKVILGGYENSIGNYGLVSHNPVTKTNTVISDPNYWYGRATLMPNREILVIGAHESATSTDVVVLEDLVAHTKTVIKQQGVNLGLDDISFDGKYVFMDTHDPISNLFVYRMSDGVLRQATHYTSNDVDGWFNIIQDLSSEDTIIFERHCDNGTKELRSYKFTEDKLTKISN